MQRLPVGEAAEGEAEGKEAREAVEGEAEGKEAGEAVEGEAEGKEAEGELEGAWPQKPTLSDEKRPGL